MAARIIKDIKEAAGLLQAGKLLAIPTETVYGLAANAFEEKAVSRIFKAKKRPSYDPLIVHLSSARAMEEVTCSVPEMAKELAKAFWPGPLTLILPRAQSIPDIVTAGLDTVGVRVPNHPLTAELLNSLPFPLAAPSANPFGFVSPTSAEHVEAQLGDRIDAILDGGVCKVGLESTIIAFPGGQATIYRYGGLEIELIEEITGPLARSLHLASNPLAPGMLKKHYSPGARVYLGNPAELALHMDRPFAILSFSEKYEDLGAEEVFTLSGKGDLHEAAHRLYAGLRYLDSLGVPIILAELLPDKGLGQAINDRLRRAAARELH